MASTRGRSASTVKRQTKRGTRTTLVLVLTLCAVVWVAATAQAFHLGYQTTARVSVSSEAGEGDAGSGDPAVSADGRYVAFQSAASNLVGAEDSNGFADVFVHDLESGQTERVSVSSAGAQSDNACGAADISADGRWVTFTSNASTLVPDDGNGCDVFVHDRQTGETERVSVSSAGAEANDASFFSPSISADGRYVAFESWASNLVPDDTNSLDDVFVHDRHTGETERVSVSSAGAQSDGEGYTYGLCISGDGRYVAFESRATTLVAGDGNGVYDVFVHDRHTGETERVSVSSAGVEGDGESRGPAISADGRYVAFTSLANNLVADDSKEYDVFVHDRQTGETERVSLSLAGTEPDAGCHGAAISADGRYVAFESAASNLVPDDGNGLRDVFVRDRQSGETSRVSLSSAGAESDDHSTTCAISGDGRLVAFVSAASNLVVGDTNHAGDVFVHDGMKAGSTITVTSSSKTLAKYGDPYVFSGRLQSDTMPLAGCTVRLQTAPAAAGPWADAGISAAAATDGSFSLRHVPRSKTFYRARFAGEDLEYDACVSGVRYAVPRASVGNPGAPKVMYVNQARSVSGYLRPRHTAGSHPVRIYKYRYLSGAWRSAGYVKAVVSNYASYSRYTGSVKLTYAGRWRLRAYHPADAGHAASWSAGYDYVTVR